MNWQLIVGALRGVGKLVVNSTERNVVLLVLCLPEPQNSHTLPTPPPSLRASIDPFLVWSLVLSSCCLWCVVLFEHAWSVFWSVQNKWLVIRLRSSFSVTAASRPPWQCVIRSVQEIWRQRRKWDMLLYSTVRKSETFSRSSHQQLFQPPTLSRTSHMSTLSLCALHCLFRSS